MSQDAEQPEQPAAFHKTAKVYDLDSHILISGPDPIHVTEALKILVEEDGAQLITPTTKLGLSWVAACSHPIHKEGECQIAKLGLKTIIYGPSERAVALEVAKIKERGANVLQHPHFSDGQWTAVLDAGGLQGIMHFDR